MDEDEFFYWLDRSKREPFGSQVDHDNWAVQLSYLESIMNILLSIRSAICKGRAKVSINKSRFNRSKTGAILREVHRLIEAPLTDEEHDMIQARFAADREAFRRFNRATRG